MSSVSESIVTGEWRNIPVEFQNREKHGMMNKQKSQTADVQHDIRHFTERTAKEKDEAATLAIDKPIGDICERHLTPSADDAMFEQLARKVVSDVYTNVLARHLQYIQTTGPTQDAEDVKITDPAREAEDVQRIGPTQDSEDVKITGPTQVTEDLHITGPTRNAEDFLTTDTNIIQECHVNNNVQDVHIIKPPNGFQDVYITDPLNGTEDTIEPPNAFQDFELTNDVQDSQKNEPTNDVQDGIQDGYKTNQASNSKLEENFDDKIGDVAMKHANIQEMKKEVLTKQQKCNTCNKMICPKSKAIKKEENKKEFLIAAKQCNKCKKIICPKSGDDKKVKKCNKCKKFMYVKPGGKCKKSASSRGAHNLINKPILESDNFVEKSLKETDTKVGESLQELDARDGESLKESNPMVDESSTESDQLEKVCKKRKSKGTRVTFSLPVDDWSRDASVSPPPQQKNWIRKLHDMFFEPVKSPNSVMLRKKIESRGKREKQSLHARKDMIAERLEENKHSSLHQVFFKPTNNKMQNAQEACQYQGHYLHKKFGQSTETTMEEMDGTKEIKTTSPFKQRSISSQKEVKQQDSLKKEEKVPTKVKCKELFWNCVGEIEWSDDESVASSPSPTRALKVQYSDIKPKEKVKDKSLETWQKVMENSIHREAKEKVKDKSFETWQKVMENSIDREAKKKFKDKSLDVGQRFMENSNAIEGKENVKDKSLNTWRKLIENFSAMESFMRDTLQEDKEAVGDKAERCGEKSVGDSAQWHKYSEVGKKQPMAELGYPLSTGEFTLHKRTIRERNMALLGVLSKHDTQHMVKHKFAPRRKYKTGLSVAINRTHRCQKRLQQITMSSYF